MIIYFLSSNKYKIDEVSSILASETISVVPINIKINELQSTDMEHIVRHKVLEAFKQAGRPVLVEQTGLYLEGFDNFPGGLTQIIWDEFQADKFCEYFSRNGKAKITAKSVFAYCNGKNVEIFDGETKGIVTESPRGNREFQWDCIFQPDSCTKTFAEMPKKKKDEISMRKKALEKFKCYLETLND